MSNRSKSSFFLNHMWQAKWASENLNYRAKLIAGLIILRFEFKNICIRVHSPIGSCLQITEYSTDAKTRKFLGDMVQGLGDSLAEYCFNCSEI